MGIVVRFPRRHARASSSSTGQRSGRSSSLGTPVSFSIGKTNSAGTPFLDRVSQYQTCDCVVPMRSAKGFCPPAKSQARFSASVDMDAQYPYLGTRQPKNLCATTNLRLGNFGGMSDTLDPIAIGVRIKKRRTALKLSQKEVGAALRERGLRGYSQQNILSLEKGFIKDPRQQAADLAGVLTTTADWLLYERGLEVTGPPVMTPKEYAKLPLAMRERLTAIAAELNVEVQEQQAGER